MTLTSEDIKDFEHIFENSNKKDFLYTTTTIVIITIFIYFYF